MKTSKISTISKIYAKALFETLNNDSAQRVKKQLNEIIEVFESSHDLHIVMTNSSISISKKLDVIGAIFGGKVDINILNFLKVIVEKNRYDELKNIVDAYCDILDNLSNIKKVVITSSIPLNFENKTNVLFKLEQKLGCDIQPEWVVDKSVIAGLVFQYDDCVIDTSIRAKLESLSKNIMK